MVGDRAQGTGGQPILPSAETEVLPTAHTHAPPPPPPPQWYPEVNHFCKEVPLILVGCKTDLRKDSFLVHQLRENKLEPVTYHRVGNPARGQRAEGRGAGRGSLRARGPAEPLCSARREHTLGVGPGREQRLLVLGRGT